MVKKNLSQKKYWENIFLQKKYKFSFLCKYLRSKNFLTLKIAAWTILIKEKRKYNSYKTGQERDQRFYPEEKFSKLNINYHLHNIHDSRPRRLIWEKVTRAVSKLYVENQTIFRPLSFPATGRQSGSMARKKSVQIWKNNKSIIASSFEKIFRYREGC